MGEIDCCSEFGVKKAGAKEIELILFICVIYKFPTAVLNFLRLLGYNNNGTYVHNLRRMLNSVLKKIGKPYFTDSILLYFNKNYHLNLNIDDLKSKIGEGHI